MGGRAAPIEPRSVGDVSDQLREQLALGVGADRLGGRREIDLPTREQQDQSSQLVEDRRVLDRRRNKITQAAELNTLAIKEVIYSIVGRFQKVAVDVQWRRMRGRDAEKQTDRHGQSSQKVFESHITPLFVFVESSPPLGQHALKINWDEGKEETISSINILHPIAVEL